MFNKYLIEKFIPWSLKVECKNAITLLTKEKEKYICDMYNHFASSYNDLAVYELHMFRVSTNQLNAISSELISIMLFKEDNYHSIHLVHGLDKHYYFIIDKNYNVMFDKKVIGKVKSDISDLTSIITNTVINNA